MLLITESKQRSIREVTINAQSLQILRIGLHWSQTSSGTNSTENSPFNLDDIKEMMIGRKSRLRHLVIGSFVYKGHWVLCPTQTTGADFEVVQSHIFLASEAQSFVF